MGAFKLLPLLIKNGIDNVEKFQKTSPEYLNTLGVSNAQIYQAKLKSALVRLLPVLAFAGKSKTPKATTTETTATDKTNGAGLKGNSADSTNQSSAATGSPPPDSVKAKTELKLFVLSANLPLQFANLMFEVSALRTSTHTRLTKSNIVVCPCHFAGWRAECSTTSLHCRQQR